MVGKKNLRTGCPRCMSRFPLGKLTIVVRSDVGIHGLELMLCAACRLVVNDVVLRIFDTKLRKFLRNKR